MAGKSSYRIGKPWRGGQLDRRNYITYLRSHRRGAAGSDVPPDAIQDGDYSYLLDGDGSYLQD